MKYSFLIIVSLCIFSAYSCASKIQNLQPKEDAVLEVKAEQTAPVKEPETTKAQQSDSPASDEAETQNTLGALVDDEDYAIEAYIRCDAKVAEQGLSSIGTAPSPTLEEARDAAVFNACRNLCAERYQERDMDVLTIESLLDDCAERCSDSAEVLGVTCIFEGAELHSEGEWSPEYDEAPRNGAEDL
ncbi:MAG: hypothetical protein ACOX8U_03450 [Bradymonadia bacterium]|jgi:hypothetical protein